MLPFEYTSYSCPNCEDDVEVPMPASHYVTCQSCKTNLELHPDAEFDENGWHDRTHLSIVDEDREHKERMLKHGLDWIADNASGTEVHETNERAFDGEDAEGLQRRSEQQGTE